MISLMHFLTFSQTTDGICVAWVGLIISFDNGDAHALAIGRPTSMCITAKKKLWVDLGEIYAGLLHFVNGLSPLILSTQPTGNETRVGQIYETRMIVSLFPIQFDLEQSNLGL